MSTALSTQDLVCRYGRMEVLKKINLNVPWEEIISIVGSNGAGKTTLLRSLSGLKSIHTGQIFFNQKEISHLPTIKRVREGLTHVLEGRSLFVSLSVEINLLLGGYLEESSVLLKERLEKVYCFFPVLREKRYQKAEFLSGGQQQMLALGRALMSKPRILLLDEPSMGLSPILQTQIFEMIKKLKREGISIVLVEQNAYQAMLISDYTYVLENGEIVYEGISSNLLQDEKIKQSYLGG